MNFNKSMGISHPGDEAPVGADLSRPPPIYRPSNPYPDYFVNHHKSPACSAAFA
jgi:hypothetical protein